MTGKKQKTPKTIQVSIGKDFTGNLIVGDQNRLGAARTSKSFEQYVPPRPPARNKLSPAGDLPSGSRMPIDRNTLFTGRVEPLLNLAATLLYDPAHRPAGAIVTQAIHGMGGIGKTQLAVEFVWRYGRYFSGVHWLNAANPADLKNEIASCGKNMGIQPWPDGLDEQVTLSLRKMKEHGQRLIVLDNFEDLPAARWILGLLRQSSLHILVTSRQNDWPADIGLSLLSLECFNERESLEFLRQYLKKEHATDDEIRLLSLRLGYLPLALELSGRYLQRHQRTVISKYITELSQTLDHPSMRNWRKELGNPTGHDLDLFTTFALSWEQIKDKDARLLFMMCGYCAPHETIPSALLERACGFKSEKCDEIINLLTGSGLLRPGPAIHPLLGEFSRTVATKTTKSNRPLAKLAHTLVVLATQANEQINATGDLTWFDPLRPHVATVGEYAEQIGLQDAAKLFEFLGYYLKQNALHETLSSQYRQDIDKREAYERALQSAKTAHEHALRVYEASFGPNHPNIAALANSLGDVLKELGDLEGARLAYERALNVNKSIFGPRNPDSAVRFKKLGMILQDLGDLRGAKTAFEKALRLDEAIFGPKHPNVATDINNLGSVLMALGDLKGARSAFERALALDEIAFGSIHPNIATDFNNLGSIFSALGDTESAQASFERALSILRQFLPQGHPDIRVVEGNLEALGNS